MSRLTQGSSCSIYAYGAITRYGRTFQTVLLILRQATGLFRVRSPLLAESLLMSFPPGTEMFQFPGFASSTLWIHVNDTLAGGLPHSDIHGSTPARGSPWLFAACHVLHRLLVPRHPPNALIMLEIACPGPKSRNSPCTETILRRRSSVCSFRSSEEGKQAQGPLPAVQRWQLMTDILYRTAESSAQHTTGPSHPPDLSTRGVFDPDESFDSSGHNGTYTPLNTSPSQEAETSGQTIAMAAPRDAPEPDSP